MNRPLVKHFFPQLLVLMAAGVLSGAMALAQYAPVQPPAPDAAARTDSQIEMDVVHALDASTALGSDLITAATIQGEVTLSGTVSQKASRELAGSIASQVPGVVKVNNNLKVGNPQDAANVGSQPNEAAASAPENEPAPSADYPEDQSQGGYPPSAQAPNAPPQPPAPAYQTSHGLVTVPPGTLLVLRTSEAINSKRATDGTPVQFTVIQDVAVGGVLAIPRGATMHGVVTDSKRSGALGGSPELALRLTSLDLGGRNYPLATGEFRVKGPSKTGHTVGHAIGGALLGAIIGGAAGGGSGAAIGAGSGAAAGTAVSAATPGPEVWIPAEARIDFHMAAPLTVMPVSAQEANRLAQGLYPGGPALYQRGYPAYGRPYPPYPYPPVYYRPYYVVDGYPYWR
jgi:hypothetical protein